MARTVTGVAMAALLFVAGCDSKEDGARKHFSRDVTCPTDRVDVRARPDLRPSMWFFETKPPADVAKDPDRLRMWQAAQDRVRESMDDDDDVYEAHGCGHEKLYGCHRHNRHFTVIMCSELFYKPGMSRPW